MSRARDLSNLANQNALSVDSSSFDVGISSSSPDSDLNVGASIKMDGPSGIITATSFVGDGSSLTGIANTAIIAANQLTVLGLELSSGLKIEITPPGESSQISRESVLDGISFAITPDDFVIRFNVSDAVNSAFFRLNSATYGQLGDDRLGY